LASPGSLEERIMNFQDDQISSRIKLGFTPAVLSSFHFLIEDYKFKCVKTDVTFVRYESKSMFVNIYHGRISCEIGVEIGKLEEDPSIQENWYTIGEILDTVGVRKDLKFTFFQSSDKDVIKKLLGKLAEYVKNYAEPMLNGDLEMLEKVQALRKEKSDAYIKEMNLRPIREMADIAWRQRDYVKFVGLYSSVEDDLTSVELKKLEYARKKIYSE
jgi:hypothetical protein